MLSYAAVFFIRKKYDFLKGSLEDEQFKQHLEARSIILEREFNDYVNSFETE